MKKVYIVIIHNDNHERYEVYNTLEQAAVRLRAEYCAEVLNMMDKYHWELDNLPNDIRDNLKTLSIACPYVVGWGEIREGVSYIQF